MSRGHLQNPEVPPPPEPIPASRFPQATSQPPANSLRLSGPTHARAGETGVRPAAGVSIPEAAHHLVTALRHAENNPPRRRHFGADHVPVPPPPLSPSSAPAPAPYPYPAPAPASIPSPSPSSIPSSIPSASASLHQQCRPISASLPFPLKLHHDETR